MFQGATQIDWSNAGYVMAVFLLPMLTLCLTGPGLAVLVRRRALQRFETAALLAVILLGMALSAAFFAYLATRYEQPQRDQANGVVVARFVPRLRISVQLEDGQARTYWQHPAARAETEELKAALAEYKATNAAAPVASKPQPTMGMDWTPADEQAYADMEKIDTGVLAATPARKAAIETAYRHARDKIRLNNERVGALIGSGIPDTPMTARQDAAFKRLSAASARLAAAVAVPASPAQGLVSRQIGILAVAILTCGVFLLVCWLGGLVDLSTYLRQRGRLVDVLQKKELERARADRSTAELRLSVLAAQVEPHFLFNTLASIRSAIDTDPQRAAHIVDHMVAFLRSAIPQMRDEAANTTVTLDSQLHMARCYLALMHERMARLQFSVRAEAGLDATLVTPLMLISLVENAVKHGVEPKIGPAHISVAARRAGSDSAPELEINVGDDGVGFGDAASGDGLGLANIHERLRNYFGQRASLTLKALPGGGVAAILRLPLSFEH
ncbi:sensor histidine kinase [Massilia sp. TWP1-3-3]|uniref:sensor histidine kinase n=1 Tax=Massilia sp. TWP1-3-3 TaxID=2804573 RepID=UPI003CFA6FD2